MTANDGYDSFLIVGTVCKNRHSCHKLSLKGEQNETDDYSSGGINSGRGSSVAFPLALVRSENS